MPGLAAAAFARAVAPPANHHVSVSDWSIRCSNDGRQRRPKISVSVAAPSKAPTCSSAGLFFGERRLSVNAALFTRKAGFSSLSSKGGPFSHIGSSFPSSFGRDEKFLPCRTPTHPRPRRPLEPLRAYLDLPHNIPYPKFTTKPEWWWRTLSCVPYLMALQISDTAFYFVPLMERYEQFEFLSYYVPGAIRRLPTWFLMVYCFSIYVGVVRNRKWPHYFRHHVMMGLLLENCIQITWYASNFLPLIHYNGTFGLYYWAGVGLMYVLLLLECVRCAVAGKYVNLPFISDAAYIHTPYIRGDD